MSTTPTENDMSTKTNKSPFKNDYLKAAKVILSDHLGISEDDVLPEKRLTEDLGADSLDLIELIMAFEEEFNIEISDEDAEKCKTVADIVAYMEKEFPTTPTQ